MVMKKLSIECEQAQRGGYHFQAACRKSQKSMLDYWNSRELVTVPSAISKKSDLVSVERKL